MQHSFCNPLTANPSFLLPISSSYDNKREQKTTRGTNWKEHLCFFTMRQKKNVYLGSPSPCRHGPETKPTKWAVAITGIERNSLRGGGNSGIITASISIREHDLAEKRAGEVSAFVKKGFSLEKKESLKIVYFSNNCNRRRFNHPQRNE